MIVTPSQLRFLPDSCPPFLEQSRHFGTHSFFLSSIVSFRYRLGLPRRSHEFIGRPCDIKHIVTLKPLNYAKNIVPTDMAILNASMPIAIGTLGYKSLCLLSPFRLLGCKSKLVIPKRSLYPISRVHIVQSPVLSLSSHYVRLDKCPGCLSYPFLKRHPAARRPLGSRLDPGYRASKPNTPPSQIEHYLSVRICRILNPCCRIPQQPRPSRGRRFSAGKQVR